MGTINTKQERSGEDLRSPKAVGRRIQERRQEMNMSMETLGKAIGVNKSTILRYERDGIDPNKKIAVLRNIREALGVHLSWLLGYSQDKLWEDDNPKRDLDIAVSDYINFSSQHIPKELRRHLNYFLCEWIRLFEAVSIYYANGRMASEAWEKENPAMRDVTEYGIDREMLKKLFLTQELKKSEKIFSDFLSLMVEYPDNNIFQTMRLHDYVTAVCGKAEEDVKI